jgi:ribonucleoside-triphosphate reductase
MGPSSDNPAALVAGDGARQANVTDVLAEVGRMAVALAVEAGLDAELSAAIGHEVEFAIARAGLRALTPGLVRELTMAVLAERGVSDSLLRARTRVGLTVADAERLVRGALTASNAAPQNPAGTDRAIAAAIKREYALHAIFSEKVASAHLAGDIHIEKIGEPDRLFSITQPAPLWSESTRADARQHAEPALALIGAETRALAAYISGEIVWDGFNWMLAGQFGEEGTSEQVLAERAFDVLADALDNASCERVVLHLDWDPPAHLGADPNRAAPARRLMRAMLDAPRRPAHVESSCLLVVHVTPQWGSAHAYREALDATARAAAAGRRVRVALDREGHSPWLTRYGASFRRGAPPRSFCVGRMCLNLVRLAHAEGQSEEKFAGGLTRAAELAAQAHLEKRVFIEKLMALGNKGALARLAQRDGAKPFLRLDRATHHISPVGLGEATRLLAGGEDETARARRILEQLTHEAERLSAAHKIRFLISPSRSQAAPARFARLDQRREARAIAPARAYSNALSLAGEKVARDHFARTRDDGALHLEALFDADVHLNATGADPKQLAVLISRAFYQTTAAALLFN